MAPPVFAGTYTVTTTVASVDFVCDAHCSLDDAIYEAELEDGDDQILLPAGIFTGTTNADAVLYAESDDDLTITGSGIDVTILDGSALPNRNVVEIYGFGESTVISITDLTVRNASGVSGNSQAGIHAEIGEDGQLLVTNCKLSENARAFDLSIDDQDDAGVEVRIANSEIVNNGVPEADAAPVLETDDFIDLEILNTIIDSNGESNPAEMGEAPLILEGRTFISNSRITNNAGFDAGAIEAAGSLTLVGAIVSDNKGGDGAGAIATRGSVFLEDTVVAGNVFLDGPGDAAIYAFDEDATVSIHRSTISANQGTAGLWTESVAVVTNSTVAGNENCGLYSRRFDDAPSIANNSTIVGNEYSGLCGEWVVSNTILAENPPVGAFNCADSYVPIISLGHNIDDTGECGFAAEGDLAEISDVGLTPLGDYGGATPTHALCLGAGVPHASCAGPSVALDAGSPGVPGSGMGACELVDQKGVVRPQGAGCDIGAVEAACVGPDSDGDGTCDADDRCTNVGGAQDITVKPKVSLSKIDDEITGNDGLKISGEFVLPLDTSFAALDPSVDGARVVVRGTLGNVIADVAIPSGTFAGGGTRGWAVNGGATKWTYKDTTGSPINGISKMVIQDRSSKAPNQVKVLVKGKNGVYPTTATDVPITTAVVLGTQSSSEDGECGEITFAPGDCTTNGPGTKISCKQVD